MAVTVTVAVVCVVKESFAVCDRAIENLPIRLRELAADSLYRRPRVRPYVIEAGTGLVALKCGQSEIFLPFPYLLPVGCRYAVLEPLTATEVEISGLVAYSVCGDVDRPWDALLVR